MIGIDSVSRRFGASVAVQDASLDVAAGEIVVIVGTSGSGKTTLLRMINRLVEPSAGRITIAGQDTRGLPVAELRRGIGYAIQGDGLFPHRTVGGNIATVPRLLGWDRARIAARVDELLHLFDLDPALYRDRRPEALSGGQRQRVGVARALAAAPPILLMDEPFGALDPILRDKAQADLLAIQARLGTTIVLVTHDMEEALRLGHRIVVMEAGRIVQCGAPAEIVARPGSDFVRRILGSSDRALRLLSLRRVGELAEPGPAEGPPIAAGASLRTALSEALWSGRSALPVTGAAFAPARITRAALDRAGIAPETPPAAGPERQGESAPQAPTPGPERQGERALQASPTPGPERRGGSAPDPLAPGGDQGADHAGERAPE